MVGADRFMLMYRHLESCGIRVLLLFIPSDLGLEVSGGVFGCILEFVGFYKILDFGVILFDW
jgi:hypothetical protein